MNVEDLVNERVAEATRVLNYPFAAVEEVLSNAVYHRSYQINEPITVRITPEGIEVTSFPSSGLRLHKTNELFGSRRAVNPSSKMRACLIGLRLCIRWWGGGRARVRLSPCQIVVLGTPSIPLLDSPISRSRRTNL